MRTAQCQATEGAFPVTSCTGASSTLMGTHPRFGLTCCSIAIVPRGRHSASQAIKGCEASVWSSRLLVGTGAAQGHLTVAQERAHPCTTPCTRPPTCCCCCCCSVDGCSPLLAICAKRCDVACSCTARQAQQAVNTLTHTCHMSHVSNQSNSGTEDMGPLQQHRASCSVR